MAFAGLDVGTSGSKLLVYDLDGNVVYQTSRRYREVGDCGRRELEPGLVMEQVEALLLEAGKNCPETIEAMAVTSLGESVVCLDEQGRVLCNSMLTGDLRGIGETQAIIETMGAGRVLEITGLPPNELYGLPKYMWLNQNTKVIRQAFAVLFYEDFVGYRLTGKRVVSYTLAARSLAFDIRKKDWSTELLALAGLEREQMSKPAAPLTVVGTILPEMARKLHLNPELKLVAGGHDQSCAALGSGLVDGTMGECGMGTCEFMFAMLQKPEMSPCMLEHDLTCIPYILPDTYLSSLEITTCGVLKNWARDTIFDGVAARCQQMGEDFFTYMDREAAQIRTQVLILPQFGSSGNPHLSMDARGTITGLTIHTKIQEIYRAMLEGMAFQMYLAYEKQKKLGVCIETITATGGGAASDLTLQIRADVFGMKVITRQSDECGTLGCMIMAATALGAYASIGEGIGRAVRTKREFLPDTAMHEYYMEKFEKYKRLYESMYDFK